MTRDATRQITRRLALAAVGAGTLAPLPAPAQPRGGRGRAEIADCAVKVVPPLARDDGERAALAMLDEIDRTMQYLSASQADGRLLRVLVESMAAKRVVELGTSTGYSAIWIALGLRRTGGRLFTYEIDRTRAATAQTNFKRAGLDSIITLQVGDAHQELKALTGTIDLAFIDAEKEGYPDYLRQLLPKLRPGGLIVADNVRVPTPEPSFIEAITTDANLETLFLNMHGTGLAVSLKKM